MFSLLDSLVLAWARTLAPPSLVGPGVTGLPPGAHRKEVSTVLPELLDQIFDMAEVRPWTHRLVPRRTVSHGAVEHVVVARAQTSLRTAVKG